MVDILDGGGVYRREHILGLVDKFIKQSRVVNVPQIEEIRAIRGADGEDYINLNDLAVMMEMVQYLFPSLSTFLFVKAIINDLKTARRC